MSYRAILGLESLLLKPPEKLSPNLDAWFEAWLEQVEAKQSLFTATAHTGFCSDRVAGAFVSGYQSALRCLVPSLDGERAFVTFSVTEEEGNRPKHIKSQLSKKGDSFVLNGKKRWASLSNVSNHLLVAARRNSPNEERPEMVMVHVPVDSEGLTVEPMPPTAFTPEVSHGRIYLENVQIPIEAVLTGDGYSDYIKPFRFMEDTYVTTGFAASLLRLALDNGWATEDQLTLISVLSLLAQVCEVLESDERGHESPLYHLLFDQANNMLQPLVDFEQPRWQKVSAEQRALWLRDAPLLGIAKMAAGIRRERALAMFGIA